MFLSGSEIFRVVPDFETRSFTPVSGVDKKYVSVNTRFTDLGIVPTHEYRRPVRNRSSLAEFAGAPYGEATLHRINVLPKSSED